MASARVSRIATIYDERSSKYDESFHQRQAEDFVKWAELQPGQNVLDLCCGTGLVTLPAKQAVGSEGRVIGVDVSNQMLDQARRKATSAELEVTFINRDVTTLQRQDLSLEEGQQFDLITCASAFVLLEDPVGAMKHWATFLSPTGRLIIDVPTETSMVVGSMLESILRDSGLPLYGRSGVNSVSTFEDVIRKAGLWPIRIFETDSYSETQESIKDARTLFDKWIRYTESGDITDPELRESLVSKFQEMMNEAADSSGMVHDDIRFNVAIAGKNS
ncbi:MAG: hypothetical protein Q9195_009406 [Heterodermia aff. obscurata]